jgi:enoyl-CoA hydratase/3-hydroxyacyl-CoA dehydrogenase
MRNVDWLLQAAMMLLDAGMDPYAIDKVINRNFGMPMGPFRLCDLVGGDVSLKTGSMLAGNKYRPIYTV